MTKKVDVEYIEGIPCEVKNPSKKSVVKFYQESLRPEIDKYIGLNIMTDRKRAYADALELNIVLAPFVLGWLKKPCEDEYRVIIGRMTMEELNEKNKPTNNKGSAAKKTTSTKPKSAKAIQKTEEVIETKKATSRAASKNNKKD